MRRSRTAVLAIIHIGIILQASLVFGRKAENAREIHVTEGEKLTLSCNRDEVDEDTESVTWFFQGLPFYTAAQVFFGDSYFKENVVGQEYTLEMKNVTKRFTGFYLCHKQKVRKITWQIFYVTVHRKEAHSCDKPLSFEGTPYIARPSTEARLLCGIDCLQGSAVTWTKEGDSRNIMKDERVSITSVNMSSVLVINSDRPVDLGMYACSVGSTTMKIRLHANLGGVVFTSARAPNNVTRPSRLSTTTVASQKATVTSIPTFPPTTTAPRTTSLQETENFPDDDISVPRYDITVIYPWQYILRFGLAVTVTLLCLGVCVIPLPLVCYCPSDDEEEEADEQNMLACC